MVEAASRFRAGPQAGQRTLRLGRIIRRNPTGTVGAIIVLGMLAVAFLAPVIAPTSMEEMDLAVRSQSPSRHHWLGTDQFGRDILSRMIYGARVSLLVGVLSVSVAAIIGVAFGSTAAFYGRWWDDGLMRLIDILMAFPYIILAIGLIAVIGPQFINLILVIAITRVPQFARLARGQVLLLKEQEYVVAARAIGLNPLRILVRHVLPNATTPLIVLLSLTMATAINAEAALSFLGIGVQPPLASWGTMVADGRRFVLNAPWIATFPGLAISVTVLGFNLLGDALRDLLDPRLRDA